MAKMDSAWVVVSLAIFVDSIAYGLIVPVVPLYAAKLAASNFEIGIIFAVYPAVQLASMIPIGILSDRFGRKPFIFLGLIGLSLATFAYTFATTIPQLVFSRGIQGLAASATMTASFAFLADIVPSNRRGEKMGIASATMGAGLVAGPVIGGYLAELGGFTLPFHVTSLSVAILAVLILLCFRGISENIIFNRKTIAFPFKSILTHRNVVAVVAIVFMWSMGFAFLEPFFPLHLVSKFGATPMLIGLFFAVIAIPYLLTQPVFGKLSDAIGRKPFLTVGTIIYAGLLPLLILSDSLDSILMLAAIVGLVSSAMFAPALPLIADSLPHNGKSTFYGAATGLYNTAYAVGFTVGPLIGGAAIDVLQLSGFSFAYTMTVLAIGALAFALIKEPKPRKEAGLV